MTKQSQRMDIRHRIQHLDTAYCNSANAKIFKHILDLSLYKDSNCLFCYVSIAKEPDTRMLIEHAWNDGKRVVVPKCISKGIMELFEINSWNDLVPGMLNIPEPLSTCTKIGAEEIDFAIVPCLSCDTQKNRLGHGGGYYDRYLETSSFPTAALCMEKLLLDHVICESHDQPVDMVITENHIYR